MINAITQENSGDIIQFFIPSSPILASPIFRSTDTLKKKEAQKERAIQDVIGGEHVGEGNR